MKYFFVMLCIFVLSGCGASAPEVVNEPPEVKDAGVVLEEEIVVEEEVVQVEADEDLDYAEVSVGKEKVVRYTKPVRQIKNTAEYKGDVQKALELVRAQKELDEPYYSEASPYLSVTPAGMVQYRNPDFDIAFTYPPDFGFLSQSDSIGSFDSGMMIGIGFSENKVSFEAYSDDYEIGVGEGTLTYVPGDVMAKMSDTEIMDALEERRIPVSNLERIEISGKKGLAFDTQMQYVKNIDAKEYVIFDIDSNVVDRMGRFIIEENFSFIDEQEAFFAHILQ